MANMSPNKAFIVMTGVYSDRHPIAVFTDEKDAIQACEDLKALDPSEDSIRYIQVPLNTLVGAELTNYHQPYVVTFGDETTVEETNWEHEHCQIEGNKVYVRAGDEDKALKVATHLWQMRYHGRY